MKKYYYRVKYANGMILRFYCLSLNELIVTAMSEAYHEGWNPKIIDIQDEYGKTYKNIEANFKYDIEE